MIDLICYKLVHVLGPRYILDEWPLSAFLLRRGTKHYLKLLNHGGAYRCLNK